MNSENFNQKNELLELIYNKFVEFQKSNSNKYIENINLEENIDNDNKISLILLVIQLTIQAENQKMLAEKIIDKFFTPINSSKK